MGAFFLNLPDPGIVSLENPPAFLLLGAHPGNVARPELLVFLLLHQPLAQAAEDRLGGVDLRKTGHAGADGLALLLGIGAVVAPPGALAGYGEIAAALAAGQQPREQILAPPRALCRSGAGLATGLGPGACGVDQVLPRFDLVPQRLVDDPQVGLLGGEPFLGWVGLGDPAAGLGMLGIALAVPDVPPDVEFVVEDTGAARAVPVDRVGLPVTASFTAAARGRDGGCVEVGSDLSRRLAGGVFLEDTAHNRSLFRVDPHDAAVRLSVAGGQRLRAIAVGAPARVLAGLDAAHEAATGLVRKLFQKQLCEGPEDPDIEDPELSAVQLMHLDIGVVGLLVEHHQLLEVARQSVEMLEEHDVAAALRDEGLQSLKARAARHRPADSHIIEDLHDGPAILSCRVLTTQPHLILNRGRVPQIAGIAGIDGDADGLGGLDHSKPSTGGGRATEADAFVTRCPVSVQTLKSG